MLTVLEFIFIFIVCRKGKLTIEEIFDEKYSTREVLDGPLALITCKKYKAADKNPSDEFKDIIKHGLMLPKHVNDALGNLPSTVTVKVSYLRI